MTVIGLQQGSNGYSGCVDNYVFVGGADTNNDTSSLIYLHERFGSGFRRILIKFDISSIPAGATINSATLDIYAQTATVSGSCGAFRVFKPWVVGSSTYNDWEAPNSEWTTAGIGATDDTGVDNSGDGTGADRKATAESEIACVGSGNKVFTITNAVQNWLDGTWNNNGVLIKFTAGSGFGIDTAAFRASEYGTVSFRPLLTVDYTSGSSGTDATATPSLTSARILVNSPTVSISQGSIATPSLASVRVIVNSPTVSISSSSIATPSVATVTVIVNQPSISSGTTTTASPSLASVRVVVNSPTIQISRSVVVQPGLNVIKIAVPSPTAQISQSRIAQPSASSVSVVMFSPTLSSGASESNIDINITLKSEIETRVTKSGRVTKYKTLKSKIG